MLIFGCRPLEASSYEAAGEAPGKTMTSQCQFGGSIRSIPRYS